MNQPAVHPSLQAKAKPSLWAIALLVASSGFAAMSVALLSTGLTTPW